MSVSMHVWTATKPSQGDEKTKRLTKNAALAWLPEAGGREAAGDKGANAQCHKRNTLEGEPKGAPRWMELSAFTRA